MVPKGKESIIELIKEFPDLLFLPGDEFPGTTLEQHSIPKKADANGNRSWRMVIDFRALNAKTDGDAYPLPNIAEILDNLSKANYFSVFDLASGFHQIPMDPADGPKTAFSTDRRHYEYLRIPFGLKETPATF